MRFSTSIFPSSPTFTTKFFFYINNSKFEIASDCRRYCFAEIAWASQALGSIVHSGMIWPDRSFKEKGAVLDFPGDKSLWTYENHHVEVCSFMMEQ
jgi:hypothetical protein